LQWWSGTAYGKVGADNSDIFTVIPPYHHIYVVGFDIVTDKEYYTEDTYHVIANGYSH